MAKPNVAEPEPKRLCGGIAEPAEIPPTPSLAKGGEKKRDVAQNNQKKQGDRSLHLKFSGASNSFSGSPLSPSLAEDILSLLLCPLHHSKDDFPSGEKIENLKKGLEKGSRTG
jgi:hypothetical protein